MAERLPTDRLEELLTQGEFIRRHLGPSKEDLGSMLKSIGFSSLDDLSNKTVPQGIQLKKSLDLPQACSENEALSRLKQMAHKNKVFKSYIGQGYHDTFVPGVILRNVLENPGWYTQYTPYQPEISQGRLEALLNFQTMIKDLTGLEISNSSLLDEATAAAEAMHMAYAQEGDDKKNEFWVSSLCHPQTIEVVQTRAEPMKIEVVIRTPQEMNLTEKVFGVLVQYPATDGSIQDYRDLAQKAKANKTLIIAATDLLALTLLTPPGEWGADVAIGSAQRFGVPMGFGGPHAGFLATRDSLKRQMPGRIVGVSKDVFGKPAIRLALQTREQHIRREKATSNICTAQVLLANMAAFYAIYHGPQGLLKIARRVHLLTKTLQAGLKQLGFETLSSEFFDTLKVRVGTSQNEVLLSAKHHGLNLRIFDSGHVGVSLDETTTPHDVEILWKVFAVSKPVTFNALELSRQVDSHYPEFMSRKTPFLQQPIFNKYHSEHEMLRYLHRLESKDLSLNTSMIPLGSCTMKLNATSEMIPITWPEFAQIHPFVPEDQVQGYHQMIRELESWLAEITGFAATSLQPNAGSQGEYAGLLVIQKYHQSRGEGHRNICLIPQSAHGTNPASAVLAGQKVVVVACDSHGNVDLNDLKLKAEQHSKELSCLMVTYPSTHGVFEEAIKEICKVIHSNGGQVYMDGANMNAQVGLCRPGDFGPDVCHLNLHKTFCIPHGGGGPGMGPICVAKHLVQHLPGHRVSKIGNEKSVGAVSASAWGSAAILPISWMYIAMTGFEGLKQATQVAILNANYIAKRLDSYFPVLYKGANGLVAHECIVDLRPLKETSGISVEDVAKRLMDYGFHAPTMSFPVAGTLMIEPTESESKEELDRLCEALILIHGEIKKVEKGEWDRENNPLKNAPHSQEYFQRAWDKPYSPEVAGWPAPWVKANKYWPAVARVDNVYGDRNLFCSCDGLTQN